MGVVNGVLAFVPRMIEAGEEGHVVNTSSGDGGIEPLPTASVYAASKAAVTTLHRVPGQPAGERGDQAAGVDLLPVGRPAAHRPVDSDRTRPDELARERPRTTEPMTVEKLEAMAEQGGYQLPWQDLNELARVLIAGIKDDDFIVMIGREKIAETLRTPGRDLRRRSPARPREGTAVSSSPAR